LMRTVSPSEKVTLTFGASATMPFMMD